MDCRHLLSCLTCRSRRRATGKEGAVPGRALGQVSGDGEAFCSQARLLPSVHLPPALAPAWARIILGMNLRQMAIASLALVVHTLGDLHDHVGAGIQRLQHAMLLSVDG